MRAAAEVAGRRSGPAAARCQRVPPGAYPVAERRYCDARRRHVDAAESIENSLRTARAARRRISPRPTASARSCSTPASCWRTRRKARSGGAVERRQSHCRLGGMTDGIQSVELYRIAPRLMATKGAEPLARPAKRLRLPRACSRSPGCSQREPPRRAVAHRDRRARCCRSCSRRCSSRSPPFKACFLALNDALLALERATQAGTTLRLRLPRRRRRSRSRSGPARRASCSRFARCR